MKKALFFLMFLPLSLKGNTGDSVSIFNIPINNWNAKIIGLDNFYPTYLADPLGVRFEVIAQKFIYSDFDHQDLVNEDGNYLGRHTIVAGVRLSLFKFTPKNNPKLGVEIDLGLAVPLVMRNQNHDLIAIDGIYYFAIAGKPSEWLSLRFSKHHISTHLGDEFAHGKVVSPVDYDPNRTQLPVRDDFIFSAAIRPLYFLTNPQLDMLTIYGDFGFFLPGVDFLGIRQNKPHRTAYLNLQTGVELEYYFSNKFFGGCFSAFNVSAYQLNAYSPNISVSGGYIFPQDKFGQRFRIGFNYYNGRSLSNQFYNRKEKFIAFYIAIDI